MLAQFLCDDLKGSNFFLLDVVDKESAHLDWRMRLRIAMGLTYCLDHKYQLSPPIGHTNLVSSSLQLTEDCAVKIMGFSFHTYREWWEDCDRGKSNPRNSTLSSINITYLCHGIRADPHHGPLIRSG
ncbi:unnamed protein product [Brassica oleracea var. botrytis]|uniref:Uncharacterized protein n=1 Tax=Brassica oleracea var. oleracea TaxID=109376 RepID=A0A0D3B611_BRAOL